MPLVFINYSELSKQWAIYHKITLNCGLCKQHFNYYLYHHWSISHPIKLFYLVFHFFNSSQTWSITMMKHCTWNLIHGTFSYIRRHPKESNHNDNNRNTKPIYLHCIFIAVIKVLIHLELFVCVREGRMVYVLWAYIVNCLYYDWRRRERVSVKTKKKRKTQILHAFRNVRSTTTRRIAFSYIGSFTHIHLVLLYFFLNDDGP